MTDERLLEQFLKGNDPTAFSEVVRVHGPMVWGVCQRILGHHHDAEEAFQATFLVLARKASSITRKTHLANWLFGVAHRTALNAKKLRAIRRLREQTMEILPEQAVLSDAAWAEVAPILDSELQALPEKYRTAIVLCDLEGRSQKDAAAQLGCPEGTLSSQLTRARNLLRIRLVRRGVGASTGALVIALSQSTASASVPADLIPSTVHMIHLISTNSAMTTGLVSPQITALTEGVLKMMFYSQVKQLTIAVCLVMFVAVGVGGTVYQMHAAEPGAKIADEKNSEVLKKLEGKWKIVTVEVQGKLFRTDDPQVPRESLITFSGEKVKISETLEGKDRGTAEGKLTINTAKQPYEIDMSDLKEVVTKQK